MNRQIGAQYFTIRKQITDMDSFDVACKKVADMLDSNDPYTDAMRKSEECFQLDHVFKYVVVCNNDEVVETAVQDGFRTIVIKDGKDIDVKLEEKCWQMVDTIKDLYILYEKTR